MKNKPKREYNHPGWWAVRHKDGWWPGDENGVPCWEDKEIARLAMTMCWQRDGGGKLNWVVDQFTEVTHKTGEYEPKYTFDEAMKRYANDPSSPTPP